MPRTAITGYRKSSFNDPYSVYFNGTSAKMTVPVVPDPTGWCFAMWIKPGDKGIATHTYMSYNTAAFTNGIFVGAGTGKSSIEVTVYNNTTIISSRSITAVVGDWVHIAATYLPNGTCKIYRNGVLISSATSTGTMSVATAQTLTFNSRSYVGSYAQSTISNIVWQNTTTSWTDAQVLDLYQSNTVPAGVTMYLAMNEGTGTTATDTSGNSNNGTLTAPTWTTDTPTKTRTAVTVAPLPIVNADFETAPPFTAATNVTGRYIDGTAGGSVTDVGYKWKTSSCTNSEVKFDSSEKYTGNYSIKLSTLSTGAIVTVEQIYSDLSFKVKPNTNYIMTYKIKTQLNSGSSNSGAYGIMSQRNSAGTITNTNYGTSILTTIDWTQYSIRMTTYPETTYITFGVAINGSNGTGTLVMDAWFDDIEIKEVIPQRKTPDNLLSNGNFEYAPPFTAAQTTAGNWINGTSTGSSSNPQYNWALFTAVGSYSAQFDSSINYSGQNSLKVSTTAISSNIEVMNSNSIASAPIRTYAVPVLPNTTYTVTYYMKTNLVSGSATTGAKIIVNERNAVGTQVVANAGTSVLTTTDWTNYSISFTTSSTTRFLTIKCTVVGSDGAGTLIMDAWFDDITFTTTAPYRNRKSVDNLVENGDFESAPTFVAATTASGWIIGTAAASTTSNAYKWRLAVGAGTVSAQFDNTVYKNGTTSMKVSTGVGGYAEVVNATTKDTAIPILPSTSYTITGWMKTELISGSATSGARIIAAEYSGDFVGGAVKSTTSILTTTDWTQYSITWTTASTARYLVVGGNVRGNNGAADLSMNAWFDDITLVRN